ncbi:MAG: choice-of-anchor B family protein [Armatimonadota bacterium]
MNNHLKALSCLVAAVLGVAATAQFDSQNVTLYRNMPLSVFGASSGNDCWGYVAPSGREYAIMGLNNKVAFVEITDPANPVVIATVSHPSSTWGDIKTYSHYAYVVAESSGSGIQVIDLDRIDEGVVTLVRTISSPGRSHNVAIDTMSGFLYTCGSNQGTGTTMCFSLADPANPVQVGPASMTASYMHDSQIVTYTSGPYSGRQILFGSSEGRGIDIYDVTNKNSPFLIKRVTYPNVGYCHQAWLDEERKYLYVDDEFDENNNGFTTRTIVISVESLENAQYVTSFTSGRPAIDHNLYVRDGIIFEANYRSGLRIFDANVDPLNPPQVGWFDTYPENDNRGYNGAWSNYPFFPSGTVIVSDIERGLFILDVSQALSRLEFDYPNGRPELVNPSGGTRVRVVVSGVNAVPQPGTGVLHVSTDGTNFTNIPMQQISDNVYDAVFPAIACGSDVFFYVSARSTAGVTYTDPSAAPATTYTAVSAVQRVTVFDDNFEADQGWTVTNQNLQDGAWERAVPTGSGGQRGDPPSDYDGSGRCYVTGNAQDQDVDGGPTILTSPRIDMSAGHVYYLTYARWFTNDDGDDQMIVEISNDNGATWTQIDSTLNSSGWIPVRFRVSDFVQPTANMRVRYSVADQPNNSVTEGALDAVQVIAYVCDEEVEVLPSAFTVTRGVQTGGGLQDLFSSDNSYLRIEARRPTEIAAASVELVVEGTSTVQAPSELKFNFEGATSGEPALQRIELFNFQNSTWEVVDERTAPQQDTAIVVTITTNPGRFVQSGTGLVRARIGYHDRGVTFISWDGRYDRCTWTVRG